MTEAAVETESIGRKVGKGLGWGLLGNVATRVFSFTTSLVLARLLIPVNFSQMPSFYHDPALTVPPLPDLAPALTMPSVADDVARRGILRAQLTRGQNRLAWTLDLAREAVEAATV